MLRREYRIVKKAARLTEEKPKKKAVRKKVQRKPLATIPEESSDSGSARSPRSEGDGKRPANNNEGSDEQRGATAQRTEQFT